MRIYDIENFVKNIPGPNMFSEFLQVFTSEFLRMLNNCLFSIWISLMFFHPSNIYLKVHSNLKLQSMLIYFIFIYRSITVFKSFRQRIHCTFRTINNRPMHLLEIIQYRRLLFLQAEKYIWYILLYDAINRHFQK